MQRATLLESQGSLSRESVPAFRVVIAYEDFSAGLQAQRAFDFLVASLTRQWEVRQQMWKFELLRIPELREMAASDATMADLIIVACHGGHELPPELKAWVETWLNHKGEAVGLVALFDSSDEQAEPLETPRTYLERVARQAHVDFFVWPEGLPKQEECGRAGSSELVEEPLLQAV